MLSDEEIVFVSGVSKNKAVRRHLESITYTCTNSQPLNATRVILGEGVKTFYQDMLLPEDEKSDLDGLDDLLKSYIIL